jgi:hypothetical protein
MELGFGQTAHVFVAAIIVLFVRRSPPDERIVFWYLCAVALGTLGIAGLAWEYPALVGLGPVDHVIQLAMACCCALAASATAAFRLWGPAPLRIRYSYARVRRR